ncbi:MAG: hypothetical protein FWC82_00565 [Firmicutes bacterium]|nr:hypothetical protein [Bacillota bacterium]
MNIHLEVEKLVYYAQSHLMLDDLDIVFVRNLILGEIKVNDFVQYEIDTDKIDAMENPDEILDLIVAHACETKATLKGEKDKFAKKLVTIISKRPGELLDLYQDQHARNPKKADAFLTEYMSKSNFVLADALKDDIPSIKSPKGKAIPMPTQSKEAIEKLLSYGQAHLLLDDLDVSLARYRLMDLLKVDAAEECEIDLLEIDELNLPDAVLNPIIELAIENKVIKEDGKDAFSDRVMNILLKRPSEITDMFTALHGKNPQKAFEWLYDYSIKSKFIDYTRIGQNRHWEAKNTKGKLEVTINLSRPEKSDEEVEKAAKEKNKYPPCPICQENEGYSANGNYRQTLRTIPMTLGGEDWFWQYSPYSYFNQHGMAVSASHKPMKADKEAFIKMLDFVDFIPSFFIACNAALPRVGGSILSHEHFQGGKTNLPLFKVPVTKLQSKTHPYIKIEMPQWYNNVIRISYTNKKILAEYAESINQSWQNYSDNTVGIESNTGTIKHHAVAVVARKNTQDSTYSLDLILRSNITSAKYPDGVFAAHPENRPIKSEAVGVVESLGLFILPARLDSQLGQIEKYLTKESRYNESKLDAAMKPFQAIIEKLIKEGGAARQSKVEAQLNVKNEVSRICESILDNTAVFKKGEHGEVALDKFLGVIGMDRV